MLLDLRDIVKEHNLDVGGVVHVGAHTGEEVAIYHSLGIQPVFWIEANPEVLPALVANLASYAHQEIIPALISDHVGDPIPFHITNYQGMSSSIFEWGTHTQFSPDTVRMRTINLPTTTLDTLDDAFGFDGCNMLNIDIEGAGLLALKGAPRLLDRMEVIYIEIQTENVYDGAPMLDEVVSFLTDFELFDIGMVDGQGWGDALFIRKIA